jgi:hypothetical protein
VSLLETDYMRTVAAAELAWLIGVVDDLRAGTLTWSEEDFDLTSVDPSDGMP